MRTLQAIEKGTIVAEYVGAVEPVGTSNWNEDGTPATDYVYSVEGGAGNGQLLEINATRVGNWTRFINHSCRALCAFDLLCVGNELKVVVRAKRAIAAFEELTVDYGADYFSEMSGRYCLCGAKKCRYPLGSGEDNAPRKGAIRTSKKKRSTAAL